MSFKNRKMTDEQRDAIIATRDAHDRKRGELIKAAAAAAQKRAERSKA